MSTRITVRSIPTAPPAAVPSSAEQRVCQAAYVSSVLLATGGFAQGVLLFVASCTLFCDTNSQASVCKLNWMVQMCATGGFLGASAAIFVVHSSERTSITLLADPRRHLSQGAPYKMFALCVALLTLVYSLTWDSWVGRTAGAILVGTLCTALFRVSNMLSLARTRVLSMKLNDAIEGTLPPAFTYKTFLAAVVEDFRQLLSGAVPAEVPNTRPNQASTGPNRDGTSRRQGRGEVVRQLTNDASELAELTAERWVKAFNIKVPEEEKGAYEPSEVCKYFCPICMLFYDELFRSRCCENYICDACACSYIKGKSSKVMNVYSQQPAPVDVDCPYCNRSNLKLTRVLPGEEAKCYEDSPSFDAWKGRSGSARHGPLPSPLKVRCSFSPLNLCHSSFSLLKVGESFDSMKAKMVGFDQDGFGLLDTVDPLKPAKGGKQNSPSIPELTELTNDDLLRASPHAVCWPVATSNAQQGLLDDLGSPVMDPTFLPNTPQNNTVRFAASLPLEPNPTGVTEQPGGLEESEAGSRGDVWAEGPDTVSDADTPSAGTSVPINAEAHPINTEAHPINTQDAQSAGAASSAAEQVKHDGSFVEMPQSPGDAAPIHGWGASGEPPMGYPYTTQGDDAPSWEESSEMMPGVPTPPGPPRVKSAGSGEGRASSAEGLSAHAAADAHGSATASKRPSSSKAGVDMKFPGNSMPTLTSGPPPSPYLAETLLGASPARSYDRPLGNSSGGSSSTDQTRPYGLEALLLTQPTYSAAASGPVTEASLSSSQDTLKSSVNKSEVEVPELACAEATHLVQYELCDNSDDKETAHQAEAEVVTEGPGCVSYREYCFGEKEGDADYAVTEDTARAGFIHTGANSREAAEDWDGLDTVTTTFEELDRTTSTRVIFQVENMEQPRMCGAAGAAQAPDQGQTEMAMSLKPAVEAKLGTTFATFQVAEVKTQVVAGTNYFFKVDTGSDSAVHLRVFKGLPHTGGEPQLVNAVVKAAGDELTHF
ncbi:hypothetical protein CYMTET_32084 [Cymbomonas tetramitiformis]|uniref:CTCHY-type domain-containing protein n=1 Tax=Cymbomonas tetramitiformis TaxID=36881 RepID=A0AAE0KSK5_9CHLO|nr:hypothetical protein CYMTET_32084 [Cymbomonas tetramitiformis]